MEGEGRRVVAVVSFASTGKHEKIQAVVECTIVIMEI